MSTEKAIVTNNNNVVRCDEMVKVTDDDVGTKSADQSHHIPRQMAKRLTSQRLKSKKRHRVGVGSINGKLYEPPLPEDWDDHSCQIPGHILEEEALLPEGEDQVVESDSLAAAGFVRKLSAKALAATKKRTDFSDVSDDFTLPPGNLKRGRRHFKKYCLQCHSVYADNRVSSGGQLPIGPTMFECCGRASGISEQGGGVSQALDRVGGILWTDAALMNYMKNPRVMAGQPVQMQFRGITDFQTIVDIIHYMHTLTAEHRPELAGIGKGNQKPEAGLGRIIDFVSGGERKPEYYQGWKIGTPE